MLGAAVGGRWFLEGDGFWTRQASAAMVFRGAGFWRRQASAAMVFEGDGF